MGRLASVRIAFPGPDGSVVVPGAREEEEPAARRLAAAFLAVSPRVMVVAPHLCRVDARGWERRGGEPALARALHGAAARVGVRAGVGIADVAVAADAAAALAVRGRGRPAASEREPVTDAAGFPRTLIVPPEGARGFLAPLPLEVLGLSDPMADALRMLGFRAAGELADRDGAELEARFGPEGLRAHRRARGEEERLFWPRSPGEPPETSVELGVAVREIEPLLFVLGPLLDRLCEDVDDGGWHIRRLVLRLELEGGERREISVHPARPTLRRGLLHELCRAGLERSAASRDGGEGRLSAPVTALALRAVERAAPEVRQEDLFAARTRDPAAAAAALSRIRARLGEGAVAVPAPRPHHRPERRSRWRPLSGPEESGGWEGGGGGKARARVSAERTSAGGVGQDEPAPGVLRLLSAPRALEVRCEADRPAAIRDGEGLHDLVAAEGPERLSGDWWEAPYRREYYRVCTARGELLWIFREGAEEGAPCWWLHGWWD